MPTYVTLANFTDQGMRNINIEPEPLAHPLSNDERNALRCAGVPQGLYHAHPAPAGLAIAVGAMSRMGAAASSCASRRAGRLALLAG